MPVSADATELAATHTRENRGVLVAAEKRALVWMAERLPRAVTSDHLTLLGAVATLGTALAFLGNQLTPWSLALVPFFLALNWLGDSLDGTVARVRNLQRPRYGYYLDHFVDIVGACALLAGLGGSGLMHPWIAAAWLICTLLLCAETFLATLTLGVYRMSFSGVGPTELRLLLAAGALRAITNPTIEPFGLGPYRLFDVGGIIGITGMTVSFVFSAVRNTRALARIEPRSPWSGRSSDRP